jgi:hypothetical protein
MRRIAVGEETALDERHLQRPEVAGADPAQSNLGPVARLGFPADHAEGVREAGIQRVLCRQRHAFHAGEAGRRAQERGVEAMDLHEVRPLAEVLRVSARRQLELGFQHAIDAESGVNRLQAPQAANQESGPDREHHSERDFSDDQRRAEARE